MTPPIPGAEVLTQWFGLWPSFHDAEILSVHINRGAASAIRLHAWTLGRETDERGFFVIEREAVVRFEMRGITRLALEGETGDPVHRGNFSCGRRSR